MIKRGNFRKIHREKAYRSGDTRKKDGLKVYFQTVMHCVFLMCPIF